MKKNTKSRNYNCLSLLNHIKYEHLLAGISGGAISTLILHPLDLMKIRFAGKVSYYLYVCNSQYIPKETLICHCVLINNLLVINK